MIYDTGSRAFQKENHWRGLTLGKATSENAHEQSWNFTYLLISSGMRKGPRHTIMQIWNRDHQTAGEPYNNGERRFAIAPGIANL
jgi:hypothetical protein